MGAVSADHLAATPPGEMDAMAASGMVAVLLPGTTFGLGSGHYADGRTFVDRGVPVALGTDHNPGTCYCESMAFMLALATRYVRLSPAEAVVAATRNAACASGRGGEAGRLEVGWPADLVVLATSDYRDLAYRIGWNPVAGVLVNGEWARPPIIGAGSRTSRPPC
jgi:imidazolonepropionase